MRRLLLLRHAKSSWDEPALADHDRPLAPRGRRASKLIAKHLRDEGPSLDLVLCSSSRRTRETLERILPALAEEPAVEIEAGIYAASAHELLERLRAVDQEVNTVLLIGHNPGIEELALELAAAGDGLDEIRRKFPTGALATLTFEGGWDELGHAGARLTEFVTPKQLQ
jgi:phosphohistidine phosphatase